MRAKINDRTGQPVVFGKTSDERLSRICFIALCFIAIGSFTADGGLLQPTGCVKTTPQKTCFRGAKVCTNMATGKSDDQLIQPDNKLKIGTRSGTFRIGHDCVVTLHDADTNDDIHDCVVTLHDANTNDDMTIFH